MSEISKPTASNPMPDLSGRAAWIDSLLRPILAFRLGYVPVVMVYIAYGALGLIDVTRDLWIKEHLTLTPAELEDCLCIFKDDLRAIAESRST